MKVKVNNPPLFLFLLLILIIPTVFVYAQPQPQIEPPCCAMPNDLPDPGDCTGGYVPSWGGSCTCPEFHVPDEISGDTCVHESTVSDEYLERLGVERGEGNVTADVWYEDEDWNDDE